MMMRLCAPIAWTLALVAAGATADTPPMPRPDAPVADEPVQARTVTLEAAAMTHDPVLMRWRAEIAPAPGSADLPVLAPAASGSEVRQLRTWVAQGSAAGLGGVFYDNRDRGHSRLDLRRFPQITHVAYDESLRARGDDRSLAHRFLFPGPVLGNASLAVTQGVTARSLPRLAMTSPGGPMAAATGYMRNHLYVYPGHRDVRDGVDVLPAMLPYFVISYGSSGSDQPVLDTLALSLASLRPATRARLEEERLLAPALVMLLRRSLQGAPEYLSPAAHPAAIERNRLRPGVAMAAAQAMTPDTIPPLVQLRVLEDGFAADAGLARRSEVLFDTPAAVARLWRGWEGRREMVVSTAATRDPNDRPLEVHWIVVSGDPDKVRIEPLDPAGRRARVVVDWHDTPFVPRHGGLERARVEIAVIAWNGAQYSAPSFVTVAFPSHQRRVYEDGGADGPRLVSVDYDAEARGGTFDPLLWWRAPWTDTAIRDDLGRLIGWRRTGRDGTSRVVTASVAGGYTMAAGEDGLPALRFEAP
ncbi:hypothetical protein [Rhodobaculum claviforme]|uniref:Uncharacterized protein n=1 Tax=Rhodobaculum claviforme TaxID=1549854 RepID=A0A934TKS3_9RHOB|nr:hypothetical protein [Rhodobaculum claviforme]MBK5927369.1 hypothetical protein [Rhodobaculum claviforme]